MTCSEARERMLDIDPIELEGKGNSELAAHVRGCSRCAAAAQVILDAERVLGRALADATPQRAADDAMRTAARPTRRVWQAATILAAAALLAALLLRRRDEERHAVLSPRWAAVRSDIDVEAPPGKSVAVFRTGNPDIVVIWFF
jgi:hypothetical protein